MDVGESRNSEAGAKGIATPKEARQPTAHQSDPDEDDLDDLDDLLDEFSAQKVDTTQTKARDPAAPTLDLLDDAEHSDVAAEDFSKQLQDQMAALLGSVDETPEMRKEIEAMMQELGAVADLGGSASTASVEKNRKQGAPSNAEDGFQETIRKTMERMQTSGDQASATVASDESDDMISQMLKDMQSDGLDGVDGEEGFSKMLMSMMEQLTNKEILYEPMKELNDKFPEWMRKNKDTVKKDDLQRYENQQRLVTEIVAKFDEKGYSDSKAADRQYIVERMQQMQAAGSPPSDLIGGIDAAQETLGNLDAGCPQQ